MDMAYLLDILGNENRRNILTLLSYRPCYVTEISEELKVSPKAIIDHLKILEDAGLIESFYDQQKRKYYQIANNVRIEVSISPLMFNVDITRAIAGADEQKMLHEKYSEESFLKEGMAESLKHLCEELRKLNRSSYELSEAQRSIQGMISEITSMCIDIVNEVSNDQIEAEILYMLVRGPTSYEEISERLNIPDHIARAELASLMRKGLATYKKGLWSIEG
jgi:ArsR family transcriptional regulator